MALLPHQERVVAFRRELEERLTKLTDFMATPLFDGVDADERQRMRHQARLMGQLSEVLQQRIHAFKSGPPDERMVLWLQEAAPSEADPMGQLLESVALPESRFGGIEIRPLPRGLCQRVSVVTRAELPPNTRLL